MLEIPLSYTSSCKCADPLILVTYVNHRQSRWLQTVRLYQLQSITVYRSSYQFLILKSIHTSWDFVYGITSGWEKFAPNQSVGTDGDEGFIQNNNNYYITTYLIQNNYIHNITTKSNYILLQTNVHNQKLYSNFKHQLLETANGLQCTWNCDCTPLQNDTMQYIQSLLIYPTSQHVEKGYKYISMISVSREEMYFWYTLVWRKQLGSFYTAFRIL